MIALKTFLDTHKDWSSTFLLYGNTNDSVWCSDLTVRSSEQYLVRLLRSRGYKHVIFYGEAGTKGAYCLDPESARFFFGENQGIPIRGASDRSDTVEDADHEAAGQDGESAQPAEADESVEPAEEDGATGGTQGSAVAEAMMRHRRRPNRRTQTSVEVAPEDASSASAPGEEQAAGQPENRESGDGNPVSRLASRVRGAFSRPSVVRYAHREMDLAHFVMLIQPLMCEKKSHMAVVFYNIFTSDFGSVAPLRDNILNVWEQARSNNQMDNICLIMAPETMYSTRDLINRVRELGLAPKFLMEDRDGADQLSTLTCVAMGLPREDEVHNLLRRLAIVGTSDTGRRITFDYSQVDDIVTEIIYCSRSCDSRKNETAVFTTSEFMTQICGRMEDYVDSQPGTDAVEVTPDVVDEIWGTAGRDREDALEKLNRPGWEAVYRTVKAAVENAEAYQARMARRIAKPEHEGADWVVERLASVHAQSVPRPPVPHFVLLGNPGTGKSTVARLIGDVLREHGILKVGSTVEVTRNNLTSSYIAGVPKATMACVERAEEGVLFIDEAHALGRKDGGVNHEGTGKEVLSELVHAMTDPGHRFCLVMAGYPEEMREMLKGDDGLMRRIGEGNVIVIDDYGPELLEQILVSFIEANDCTLDPALVTTQVFDDVEARPLSCFVTRVYQERDRKRFGNAGDMETIGLRACALAKGGVVTEECFYQGAVNHEWFVPSDVGNSLDRIVADIRERFVGMEGVEQYFVDMSEEVSEQLAYGGSEDAVYLRPIVLRGEPGTGKTEVATMLGRLYHHLHLLGTPQPIIIQGSMLASSLQGGSQEKVLEYVREAQDRKALLFVDEAHQLVSGSFDGQGALKAFLSPLTDRAHPFMCVFAVYPSMFEAFCRLDPGSASRFQVVDLPSYTGPELHAILHKMMERHTPVALTCTPETDQALRLVCDHIYATRTEQTGNGRRMERLLEEMNKLRRRRCRAAGLAQDAPERLVFQLTDIPSELLEGLVP